MPVVDLPSLEAILAMLLLFLLAEEDNTGPFAKSHNQHNPALLV